VAEGHIFFEEKKSLAALNAAKKFLGLVAC